MEAMGETSEERLKQVGIFSRIKKRREGVGSVGVRFFQNAEEKNGRESE